MIVGGGVVMAASYEARACGVRTAMGGARARRLCPEAIVVRPRWEAYVEASRAVRAIFDRTSPVVECISIDEAFLDVTGMERIAGSPEQIARTLRNTVQAQVGLPISVGVGDDEGRGEAGERHGEAQRAARRRGRIELAFLHPLPVGRLWGVGAATAAKLHARRPAHRRRSRPRRRAGSSSPSSGAQRAATCTPSRTTASCGRCAAVAVAARSGHSARSAGPGTPPGELEPVLAALVDRVTRRTRRAGLAGRTVVLRLRFEDFTRATRSRTMHRATASSEPVLATARALLAGAQPFIDGRPLTLLGLTLTNLERDSGQLALALERRDRAALDSALDEIRDRFGAGTVSRAAFVDSDDSLAAWLMPGDGAPGRPPP